MKNRKPIFFTSDLHIGHENVVHFSKRPFKNLEDMHKTLIRNYNSVVPENGVCYFLGDIGLCNGDIIRKVISQMNGTKVLILGNHDKGMNGMYNLGFDVVMYGTTLQICQQRVTMSHCPLLGVYREDTTGMRGGVEGENWHGESKDSRKPYTIIDQGQFHLHGHIHSPNGGKSKRILGRQMDVGVDAHNFRPVSISQVESWIVKVLNDEKKSK